MASRDLREASCEVRGLQYQQYLPITDSVIRRHLAGRDDRGADFVAGVYPMLLDETCFFLAKDFDKSTWQDDSHAVLATCARIGLLPHRTLVFG